MRAAIDLLLFVVLPYASVMLFLVGTIERYRRHPYSVTSQSSQFLEGRRHFWGYMPFHLGILSVLAAHVCWVVAPGLEQRWNASPSRLYGVEILLLGCALAAAVGYIAIGLRRAADAKLRLVSGAWDTAVYLLLLAQIVVGVLVAVRHPWGSSWFTTIATPYLWSLARLNPDATAVIALPALVRVHVTLAWLLIGIFPFSRLVHVLSVPNPYLWRAPQVVRWRRGAVVVTGERS
jgi:nitrate reductase gamma subunit